MSKTINPYDEALWGIHITGMDNVLAAKNFEHAVEKCNELNRVIVKAIKPICDDEHFPIVFARIDRWENISSGPHMPENVNWEEALS